MFNVVGVEEYLTYHNGFFPPHFYTCIYILGMVDISFSNINDYFVEVILLFYIVIFYLNCYILASNWMITFSVLDIYGSRTTVQQ